MSGILCPYCNMVIALGSNTQVTHHYCFDLGNSFFIRDFTNIPESTLAITFYRCPNCGEYTIVA